MVKRPPINNQIKAQEVRVIDETGNQLGVMKTEEALRLARERNLDLIQISEKAVPPVCKIIEYGKYLYWQGKKEKGQAHHHGGEMKGIRLTYNISQHDLETRIGQAKKFLEKGDKVRIEMVLRGREKGLVNFATEKINQFVELLGKETPVKVEKGLQRYPKGFTMIIAKK